MGTNSAELTNMVIENAFQVLAIHFMTIIQAVDYLKIQDRLAPSTRKVYNDLRAIVPVFVEDSIKYKDIENIISYLKR